jgi:hypothetical protein
MGVREFRAITIVPAGLRADGAGFFAGGQFIVRAKFDAGDCARYEYRQHIKGTAVLIPGTFTASPPSRGNWVPTGIPRDAGPDFEVPGGLTSTYKEDGQQRGGRTERFGHRAHAQVLRQGLEDRYLPDRPTGCEYKLRDTWGLRGTSRPTGLLVRIDITYRGRIIDTADGDSVVKTLHWGVHIDDIIT